MSRGAQVFCRCVLLPALAAAAAIAPGCSRRPSERTVVVYTSADQEYAEQVLAEFARRYPDVVVVPRFDTEATKTTGLVERLRAERRDPQCDVFWSSEVFLTQKLADEGLLEPWTNEMVKDWPAAHRDAQGRWYGFSARARVVAYAPARVSDPPVRWLDLAEPRFKGRIVMADPNYGTTRGHVALWFALWGEQRAAAFLRDLRANGLRIVRSNSQAVRDVADGLADLALTDTDDVWAAQRNGYDVELVFPRHGDGPGEGTLLIPNTVSLVAGRPHNFDAILFAEFLLGDWCQALLLRSDSHNMPILPNGASLSVRVDRKYLIPDPLVADVAAVTAAMEPAMKAANEILLGR